MEAINKVINIIKDAYLYVIEGIANNPNTTFWVGSSLIVLGLFV